LHELNYTAPNSVAEAVQILRQHGENARPLAGGTDIIIQMRAGVRRPTHLVDVKKIP
jgi:carbon-monoxide dehydrogenase medium subunit